MSELPEFVLDRVFDAPQEMVWRTWTDPELLARWYGPGVETIIHKFDLEPGGLWLGEMKWGDKSMLSKVVFQEVTPTEKLTWLHSSCDAEWNVISNPMMPGLAADHSHHCHAGAAGAKNPPAPDLDSP